MSEDITRRNGHPMFYDLLNQIGDLHARKNTNYAEDNDPLSNLKACQRLNVSPFMGVMIRLQDKWSRLEQLAKGKPDLVGESVEDTLMDNAIYSLLAIILIREGRKGENPNG
jgi:hypothetical protein